MNNPTLHGRTPVVVSLSGSGTLPDLGVRAPKRQREFATVFQFLATQSGNTGLVVGQTADARSYGIAVRMSLK